MYKKKGNFNPFTDDILEAVCQNRGVDINKIKNPSIEDTIHYSKLVNIDKAVKLFKENIEKKEEVNIGTIVDSDNDGYVSSAILVQYIEKNFPNVKFHFFFHSGKQHGITNDIYKEISELDIKLDLLFVPDAGTNDKENIEKLYNDNIPTTIIDHHLLEGEISEYGIIVNNQISPEYTNKSFSGVGIVYKFLQALDDEFNLNDADTYLDLVSLGNIADSMEQTSPETRYYIYKGITQIRNPLLKELIYKYIGKYEKVYPHSLSFNVIPKINAIIRTGTMEEKKDMFYAFIGREEEFYNTRTKKTETLPYKVTRVSGNVHKKSGDLRKKWVKYIKELVDIEGLDSNKFIIVTLDNKAKFDKELTGLIANNLTNYYRKPVIIMHFNKELQQYRGSLRGVDSVLKDTKEFLNSLGLFEYVQGHAQAGGVAITKDNFDLLNKTINSKLADISNDTLIEVDFVVDAKQVGKSLIDNVYSYEKYWGKGIEPPIFAILNLKVDMENVKVSDGGMIKMVSNGVDYTQFTADKQLAEYAGQKVTLTMNVFGMLSVSTFLGNTSYQVIIDDFEILEVNKTKKLEGFVW